MQHEPAADEFRLGHDVADEKRELLDVLRLGRAAKARADGIDEYEIALGQPRIGILDQLVTDTPERPRDFEMERQCRPAWTAIPDERDRSSLPSRRDAIGRVE